MPSGKPHHHRHFRRIRDFVKRNSSSYAPLNYPSTDSMDHFGTSYRPTYQTGSPYGATLHPDLRTENQGLNISPRRDIDTASYHYVAGFGPNDSHIKPNLDESFYEGAPNRKEASQEHSAGLKGVKVLEPGMTMDTENVSTNESSPDTRSSRQPVSQPLAHLALQSPASCGLQNLGNTCYMNSVLQNLFNIESLRNYFLQGGHLLGGREAPLTESYVELLSTVFAKDIPVDRPLAKFKDALENVAPVFEGYAQNDAHELFRLLIENMHDEINVGSKRDAPYTEFRPSERRMTIYQLAEEWKRYSHERENSAITSVFGGILLNEVSCSSCHYISYTFEDALDLSLNLANTNETSSSHLKVASSLYTCLKRFTTPEPVEGYACESCHKKDTSTKRTTIWKQPETLVVQFKRFVSDNYGNRRALKERVAFPVGTMTLDYFTHERTNESRGQYKLQGMVNHYGDLNGGHYIAYIYNEQVKSWLKYDDHKVSKVGENEIQEFGIASVEPYLLFYKRV